MYWSKIHRITTGLNQIILVLEMIITRIQNVFCLINLIVNRGCQLYNGMINIYFNVSYLCSTAYQFGCNTEHFFTSFNWAVHYLFKIIRNSYLFCVLMYKKYLFISDSYIFLIHIIRKILSDNYHIYVVMKDFYINFIKICFDKYWMKYENILDKYHT